MHSLNNEHNSYPKMSVKCLLACIDLAVIVLGYEEMVSHKDQ